MRRGFLVGVVLLGVVVLVFVSVYDEERKKRSKGCSWQ